MDDNGPSRTALVTGYARAHHQFADRPPIFTDPLAAPLLGIDESIESATGTTEVVADRARRLVFAARARYAEDAVAAALATGTRQVVILGAGLDTFAYRNPQVRVFEVDHPATQAWKQERLAAAGIDCPAALTFVPVDFETQSLAAGLADAGFTRTEPAIFVWMGVVFYLTQEAVDDTLRYIAEQTRPFEVVFDYLQSAATDEERAHLRARAERLATIGEPLLTYFAPDGIAAQLREIGFTDIEDRTAEDVIASYLGQAPEFDAEPTRALRTSRILRARG